MTAAEVYIHIWYVPYNQAVSKCLYPACNAAIIISVSGLHFDDRLLLTFRAERNHDTAPSASSSEKPAQEPIPDKYASDLAGPLQTPTKLTDGWYFRASIELELRDRSHGRCAGVTR